MVEKFVDLVDHVKELECLVTESECILGFDEIREGLRHTRV